MPKYKESIVDKGRKCCYLCGGTRNLEIHHIFSGSNRKLSTRYGLVVTLCANCHRGINGVHNNYEKMEELRKIAKIVAKEWDGVSENLLVIDATTGQNALTQVEMFNEILPISGIILTKLDGSSKGGVVFAIAKKYGIPIKFVGVGEGLDDIEPFNAEDFVNSII